MGAESMVDIPNWLTAIGTVVLAVPSVIGALRYMVVSPLARRMDGIETKATERQDEIRTRLTEQDKAIEALDASVDSKLTRLDTVFQSHEERDVERFDDAGEKLEAQIGGLRRDVATANDQIVTHQRNDIRDLGGRIDTLIGRVIETLALLAGRKGSHPGAD